MAQGTFQQGARDWKAGKGLDWVGPERLLLRVQLQ